MLIKYSGKYVKIYFNMKITFHRVLPLIFQKTSAKELIITIICILFCFPRL